MTDPGRFPSHPAAQRADRGLPGRATGSRWRGKAALAWTALLASASLCGADLAGLAALDGAPGDESRVAAFIAERLPGDRTVGASGSVAVRFGDGAPSTLLVAGLDEPGYAVSGLHPEGYLHLRPLAEPAFGFGLARHFLGQPVRVATGSGGLLAGVVAAPSVHFAAAGRSPQPLGADDLFVDIGAENAGEALAAGVAVLDRVTLEKRPQLLEGGWLAAPWASSRSGAAALLALAGRLAQTRVQGQVTLAFVTQQYPYNAGLTRALRSFPADRVVLLAPHGADEAGLAAVVGQGAELVEELEQFARKADMVLRRRAAHAFPFGPFGAPEVWQATRSYAVLLPAVRNRATPAEAVSLSQLEALVRLLALLVGLPQVPQASHPDRDTRRQAAPTKREPAAATRAASSLERTARSLVEAAGVSGSEAAVREQVRSLIPQGRAVRVRTDTRGNLVVRLGPDRPAQAVFVAHLDEIGHRVRAIAADGSVSVSAQGGGDGNLFAWRPAAVHTSRGTVPAVMARHGSLDFGGASEATLAAMGVTEGDSVTVPKRLRRLLGERVSGRSLDDRLGCAALVEAMRRLAGPARRARRTVEFVFSVEEETGLRGARHFAAATTPSRVYPVDTFVTSDSPFGHRRFAYARLGEGPVLRALDESGLTPRAEVGRVVALARKRGVPLQLGTTVGGNDGSVFRSLRTVNIPIGFPLRYAHTPVETADLRDARAAVDLIEALALDELQPQR